MNSRHREDRLYTTALVGLLVGLVALGLAGMPALLVAALGAALAAVGIALFHRRLEGFGGGSASGPAPRHRRVPEKYVPRVLESGATRRRRAVHRRRHRHPTTPLHLP